MCWLSKKLIKFISLLIIITATPIYSHQNDDKNILYLISAHKIDEAITLYQKKYTSSHNYPLLRTLAHSILESSINNPNDDIKLLSIFGAQISGQFSTLPFIKNSIIHYKNPIVQKSLLNLVASIHEGWVDHFLVQTLRSPFIELRLDALYHLIQRNHPDAFGHIEALVRLVAPEFRHYFIELFAMDHSDASTNKLKLLLNDPDTSMQHATISKLIEHNREDFAGDIASFLSHTDPSKQEIASLAMGLFRMTNTKDTLIKIAKSSFTDSALTAKYALTLLGYEKYNEEILSMAKDDNLFALNLTQDNPKSYNLHKENIKSNDEKKALVSALALLSKKDPQCKNQIKSLLKLDTNNTCLVPISTLGGALSYLDKDSIYKFRHKEMQTRARNFTKSILHSTLIQAASLPEETFLDIATDVLENKQTFLLPPLINLLENINSEKTNKLLSEYSNSLGSPLIRYYCQLSLYRLRNNKSSSLISWLKIQKKEPIFDISEKRATKLKNESSSYSLSTDDKGNLFIETIEAIVARHDEDSVNLILSLLHNSHYKNRAILAGLLLKSIY